MIKFCALLAKYFVFFFALWRNLLYLCSVFQMEQRSKIRKNREFAKFKIMTKNEIKERKKKQMARVISMATSLHYAIEDLMSLMIAEDDDEEFSLEEPEDEELYLALGLKTEEIDKMADMISARYKAIK